MASALGSELSISEEKLDQIKDVAAIIFIGLSSWIENIRLSYSPHQVDRVPRTPCFTLSFWQSLHSQKHKLKPMPNSTASLVAIAFQILTTTHNYLTLTHYSRKSNGLCRLSHIIWWFFKSNFLQLAPGWTFGLVILQSPFCPD